MLMIMVMVMVMKDFFLIIMMLAEGHDMERELSDERKSS